MVMKAVKECNICIRVAYQAFRISESCYRYESKLDAENEEVHVADGQLQQLGFWPLLPVLAQPEGLEMESQA